MNVMDELQALDGSDREAIDSILDAEQADIGELSTWAMHAIGTKPLLALRIFAWIARQAEPGGTLDRENWLRAHNNACHLAIFHGEPDERRAIVRLALSVAPRNIAIYHNAACLLCALGDADAALDAIRTGVALGYDAATIAAIAEDADLDLIRDREEFQTIVRDGASIELPSWAEGWTAIEYTQFREHLRTTFYPDPDLSGLARGTIEYENATINVLPLAESCQGKPISEWFDLVRAYVHRILHA
ncbi:MAG: hypothetical protein AAGE52_07315 [Myxococcota bacterium]